MSGDTGHTSPHDALFKRVFGDVRRGAALLRSVLPARLGDRVDWSTAEIRSGSYVDEELRGLVSDLVFAAELDGEPAIFYLLVEHQSSPDAAMSWRLWQYVTRLWDEHKRASGGEVTLPLVIPVVVYHGERPWSAARGIDGLITMSADSRAAAGELVPRFRYVLDDLTQLDATALRARALPAVATLALWALRSASDRSFVGVVTHLADLFDEVRAADDGAEALRTLFGYLSIISRAGEDLVRDVASHLNEPVKEEIMELEEMLAQKKLEEGRAEGRAEGRKEGRAEGRAAVLLKLFQLKFGAVPPEAERLVRSAGDDEIERWTERVLTAASLDDVMG